MTGLEDNPCHYIVTVQATVLLAVDDSPVQGATVFIDTGPPDSVNTKVTDAAGRAFWTDTSFLTGFSATCGGQEVGTVEPYDADTSFTYTVFFSSASLAPLGTTITIDRRTRNVEMTVRMEP